MPLIPLTHRLRALLSLISTISTAVVLIRSQPLRDSLRDLFSPRLHPYRLTALLAALLLNSKALPLMWHVRFFTTMIYQLYLQPTALPVDALFRPLVTKGCYTTLMECDYNLHKSNSTYFADLDIGRTALIATLLRKGIREARGGGRSRARAVEHYKDRFTTRAEAEARLVSKPDPAHQVNGDASSSASSQMPTLDSVALAKEPFVIALGAVSTHFKRELKPYETFDIWTRVLAWDRKWVYVVSHIVKPNAVAEEDMQAEGCWALQPWKEHSRSRSTGKQSRGMLARLFGRASSPKKPAKSHEPTATPNVVASDAQNSEDARRAAWQKAIFATSISKYVIKKGRLTIPAEEVLIHNDLVPLRSPSPEGESGDTENTPSDALSSPNKWAWNWENIERERQRGLKLAAQFGALDDLVSEFPGSAEAPFVGDAQNVAEVRVLGSYPDVVW